MPRFSIIVPAYNAQATLAETLDAVANQHYGDWECVIIDDGSGDDTAKIASSYVRLDSRFRLVSQANRGTGGAYNAGLEASTGEFIVICSADDILLPEHLATMSAFIDEHPGYNVFSCNGYMWDERGGLEPRYSVKQPELSLELVDVISECFYGVGAAYHRCVLEQVAGYREDIFGEDWDFWLRALAAGARHRYVPAVLSKNRIGAHQKSAQQQQWWESDIRIVTDLQESAQLSDVERAAIRRIINDRQRRIARLDSPTRRVLSGFANRVLGLETIARMKRTARNVYKRPVRRN